VHSSCYRIDARCITDAQYLFSTVDLRAAPSIMRQAQQLCIGYQMVSSTVVTETAVWLTPVVLHCCRLLPFSRLHALYENALDFC
jgi:hypothetical protein